jgi:Fe-S cluster assembly ATP-binding protein
MTSKEPLLVIKDLHVKVEDKEILKGVNLTVNDGEVHALMGRNGSGKSTLSYTLMGHPRYHVTEGQILYRGQDLTGMTADERARAGIYLAFQYPVAVPGVSVSNFLRAAVNAKRGADVPVKEFRKELRAQLANLAIKDDFLGRYVNEGFSGGEKKRLEVLQMSLLKPTLAMLDETDSGLDIDALKTVAQGINAMTGPDIAIIMITHYQRMLEYIKPGFIHIMQEGKIVLSGGAEVAQQLEAEGYDWVTRELASSGAS